MDVQFSNPEELFSKEIKEIKYGKCQKSSPCIHSRVTVTYMDEEVKYFQLDGLLVLHLCEKYGKDLPEHFSDMKDYKQRICPSVQAEEKIKHTKEKIIKKFEKRFKTEFTLMSFMMDIGRWAEMYEKNYDLTRRCIEGAEKEAEKVIQIQIDSFRELVESSCSMKELKYIKGMVTGKYSAKDCFSSSEKFFSKEIKNIDIGSCKDYSPCKHSKITVTYIDESIKYFSMNGNEMRNLCKKNKKEVSKSQVREPLIHFFEDEDDKLVTSTHVLSSECPMDPIGCEYRLLDGHFYVVGKEYDEMFGLP